MVGANGNTGTRVYLGFVHRVVHLVECTCVLYCFAPGGHVDGVEERQERRRSLQVPARMIEAMFQYHGL
jgi:hypothetical protein